MIVQEAIACWGHLASTVYCPAASAASYTATDLVPPVLGKLVGSAEGLVRASQCKPGAGQAKAFDTPLPLESALQASDDLATGALNTAQEAVRLHLPLRMCSATGTLRAWLETSQRLVIRAYTARS